MPSPEQTRKIKTRFEIASVPFSTVREDDSRRAKHGRERLQYDHWKAKDATRRRIQEKLPFLFCTNGRQTNDIKNLNGITDGQTYCEYLDYFATVDATYIATWPERSRYHNILVLKLHDGKTSGKMPYRDDFKLAARSCSRTPGWKGKPLYPEVATRTTKDHSMKSCDQNLIGKFDGSQASSSSSTAWWQPQEWQEPPE